MSSGESVCLVCAVAQRFRSGLLAWAQGDGDASADPERTVGRHCDSAGPVGLDDLAVDGIGECSGWALLGVRAAAEKVTAAADVSSYQVPVGSLVEILIRLRPEWKVLYGIARRVRGY